jgi:hypothetical protein
VILAILEGVIVPVIVFDKENDGDATTLAVLESVMVSVTLVDAATD